MEPTRWAFLISGVNDPQTRERLEALAPALERLGTWKVVERPESRLVYSASVAKSQGLTPVHLALGLPQSTYFTPALPTVLAPVWDYPDVPRRSFIFDVRQNWTRLAKLATCVMAPSAGQAASFARSELDCPVVHVPTPARQADFDLPAWNLDHSWTLDCRHVILGATSDQNDDFEGRATWKRPELGLVEPPTLKRKAWNQFRHAFHAISPYYSDDARIRNMKIRKSVLRLIGRNQSLGKLPRKEASVLGTTWHFGKLGFDRTIRPYLSPHALVRMESVKTKLKRVARRPLPVAVTPVIPSSELTVSGLVYTAVLDPGEARSNLKDLITSFFMAFADRDDVTLVVQFTTPEARGFELASHVTSFAASLGLQPRCRVAVICEPLTDSQQSELLRASTYVATATLAEAEPLFLRRALAGGRLVIGPDHGALGEFLDDQNAFIVESNPEPTYWPHDPERKHETYWHRPVWSDLKAKFVASAEVAETTPSAYAELASLARAKVASVASVEGCVSALEEALELVATAEQGRFAWVV